MKKRDKGKRRMAGMIFTYLAEDHERLDALLLRASAAEGVIAAEPYGEFRKGLLRHIAMEEKVALPAIARLQGGKGLDAAARIRLDHGALVSLLVPPPTRAIVATIRSILVQHNRLEEREGGFYAILEEIAGQEAELILEKLRAVPEVRVLPHNDRPEVLEATKRAVERAGYRMAD